MELPRIRVALVIIQNEKILLVQHCKGGKCYWLLPGGGLDYGETIQECAIRELLEETNLKVKLKRLLFVSESIPEDRHRHIVNLYFEAEVCGGELKRGKEQILQDVRFFDLKELDGLTIYPPIRESLKEIMKKEKISLGYLGNMWV